MPMTCNATLPVPDLFYSKCFVLLYVNVKFLPSGAMPAIEKHLMVVYCEQMHTALFADAKGSLKCSLLDSCTVLSFV